MIYPGNSWNRSKFIPYKEMLSMIESRYHIEKMKDQPNDTSKVIHRVSHNISDIYSFSQSYAVPGFTGKFGFITSMSDHFCGSCNRLRLLTDGNLKVFISAFTSCDLVNHYG